MPLASLLRDRLLALVAQGGAEQDWSAIARLAARDAGLEGKDWLARPRNRLTATAGAVDPRP